MYIFLDASISELDFNNSDNLSKIEFLFMGYAEGNYILSAPRFLLRQFLYNENLSKLARNAIAFAYENFSMMQSFFSKIPFKITIKRDFDVKNEKDQWIIDLDNINYGFLANGITILAENLNDSKFLNYTARHFQLTNDNYKIFKIINNFHGGGGSTTPNELKNLLNQKLNYIFCFLDSDKESPHCIETSTAKKCIKNINENLWIAKFCSTKNFREAENLIPKSLLESIEHFPTSNLEYIRYIENKYNINFYPYIDIKNGLTKKFINKVRSTESPKKKFWEDIIRHLKTENINIDCNIINGKCETHIELKESVCQIIPAGTQKTLEQTIQFLENTDINDSFKIIKNDNTNKEWFEIGEIVFWLSCALPKIRLS
ncbi:hypothetical protein [Acinetobacter baumannii]|uniref:Uncharacterized protein n=2 Tax=Acinetobacter baumannii TaxID=470 RepID=A0A335G3Y4_ACIBA|nr:hypothetical protein [Acinetobacter baumannii]EXR47934.1 hypothetical protein J661_2179 [Acinetobacter baumannii 1391434]MCT9262172.1 hypothetical protein [Acinetobacter baumannii]MDC4730283.1 hypothetical protein [Acinetobacter baumannii]WNX64156.1 hypothetical protein RWV42_03495 [Acinetobacter baumannii]SSO96400.1 Uncharacterised protein [Acinetobacter baumannii]